MANTVEWIQDSKISCKNAIGDEIIMDWEHGPSPVQLLLQSVAACSIVDVVGGLSQREVKRAWIEIEAERAETSPRYLTSLTMIYHVEGAVPKKLVERLVKMSHEKYCSVSNSLRKDMEMNWQVEIHS
jgi:putative redox protein